jgi:hypothetical protein
MKWNMSYSVRWDTVYAGIQNSMAYIRVMDVTVIAMYVNVATRAKKCQQRIHQSYVFRQTSVKLLMFCISNEPRIVHMLPTRAMTLKVGFTI